MAVQKISPFLWFDTQAEDAAGYYVSIFANSRITQVTRYGSTGPGPAGTAMTVAFELEGQKFTALNGGPHYQFNNAVSFMVHCDTQSEIDNYWTRLSAGGKEIQCGWLNDRFGLAWQIVPAILPRLLSDPEKTPRVMQALVKMIKLDIRALQEAHDQV